MFILEDDMIPMSGFFLQALIAFGAMVFLIWILPWFLSKLEGHEDSEGRNIESSFKFRS